jgi:NAD(P)-dependent dehydrogenase (short-subunit alcohol dehydrogenase family)
LIVNDSADTKRLAGRIALVTGASRGIGSATAKILAAEGAHVILVARTQGGLEEIDDEIRAIGGTATLMPLDLTQYDLIDRMGAAIFERWGKLDILVGNAGLLGGMSPVPHFKPEIWDQVFAVNVTANWRLIRSLDPLLRSSDAGRAVFMTSIAGRIVRPYWGLYSTSKAALEMMVKTYALEVASTAMRVNLFNPNRTRTTMRAEAYPGEKPETVKTAEQAAIQMLPLVLPSCTANAEVLDAVETEPAQ